MSGSLSALGLAASGLGRTVARAAEHGRRLDLLKLAYGEVYMRRVERMYLESPWGLDKSEEMVMRLAVFEWMANPPRDGDKT